MAFSGAARSFCMPAIDLGRLHGRAPIAFGAGFASIAGASFRRLSPSPSKPFASLGISTDTSVKEVVQTEKAPAALGPYSQAIKANNLLFVSGVLGLVPEACLSINCQILVLFIKLLVLFSKSFIHVAEHVMINCFCTEMQTGKFVSDSVEDQTEQVLKNIGEILKAGGVNYSNVVKTTILLADLKDFKTVNEIYAKYFPSPAPARATYQVAALPMDAKIEIECIAAL
nr:reactive Intermediate Deaminase A, chloroplastic-like [Ipomoea batatas]GME15420.1 reactive Intermediate Deaminase A, chloroplastic-like [Ipomoea batatas]